MVQREMRAKLSIKSGRSLMTAVDRFSLSKKTKFSTYASWWIKQGICRAISNTGRLIRIPVHKNESLWKLYKAERAFSGKTGRKGTAEEISTENGMKIDEV